MSDDARTWTDEDARMVAEALRCAETGNATHWPTVAGWLAAEVARLRAQVAKLESTGDRVADALHGEVGDYYFLVEQWRTMRAELDRHRVAGDAMADDILHVDPDDPNANEWRSVRGDAPTAGGLLPDKRILIDLTPPSRAIPADQRRKLAAELRSRFVDGPVDEWSAGWLSAAGYIGSDSPIGTDAGTDLAAPAVAPTEPPAAPLPVTLSSPDAVGKECETRGLTRRLYLWEERAAGRSVTVFPGARGGAVAVMWWVGDEDTGTGGTVATLPYPVAAAVLVAAIEAARGGSR